MWIGTAGAVLSVLWVLPSGLRYVTALPTASGTPPPDATPAGNPVGSPADNPAKVPAE